MTADTITAIKKALEGVTVQEWTFDGPDDNIIIWCGADTRVCFMTSDGPAKEHAQFITACQPAAISHLLSTLESLQRENEALKNLIDGENCADPDKIDALFRRAEAAEAEVARLQADPVAELRRINEMMDEGDNDGALILPEFEEGLSVEAKVEKCLHLLEKRLDVIEGFSAKENWRDDPAQDERWNAGLDFAMLQLCKVLKVDPQSINWDCATETLEGDAQSQIHKVLAAAPTAQVQDVAEVSPAEYMRRHDAAIAAYEANTPSDYRYSAFALRKAVDAAFEVAAAPAAKQGEGE